MSGIYIPGMEMPKDRPQLFWVYPNGKVLTVQSDADPWKELQAVPVPPHGKLKDADAIDRNLLKMQQAQTGPCSHGVRKSRAVLRDAPTIIPASEEGKT